MTADRPASGSSVAGPKSRLNARTHSHPARGMPTAYAAAAAPARTQNRRSWRRSGAAAASGEPRNTRRFAASAQCAIVCFAGHFDMAKAMSPTAAPRKNGRKVPPSLVWPSMARKTPMDTAIPACAVRYSRHGRSASARMYPTATAATSGSGWPSKRPARSTTSARTSEGSSAHAWRAASPDGIVSTSRC
jgi:hypothetical protein